MLSRIYSFKFIIGFALLWLGALAFGLAFYSTYVYRDHAIESQIETLHGMLGHESDEAIQKLYDRQKQFAFKLQNEAPFRLALEQQDEAAMEAWLTESYTRYQVASGMFRLKTIVVRGLTGEIFAQSSDDGQNAYAGCPSVLKSIGGSLIRLIKPEYALCSFDGQLFTEVLVPVGALEPKAYLHVVAYAVDGLQGIEQGIDIPLRILNASGVEIYRSPHWVSEEAGTHLYPQFRLYGDDAFSVRR